MAWLSWLNSQWQKRRNFTPAERKLFFLSLILLPLIQLGLKLGGLSFVQTTLFRVRNLWHGRLPTLEHGDIAPVVAKVINCAVHMSIFQPACLAKSLCAWFFLLLYGVKSELRIGIGRSEGKVTAHAWIEQSGQVLNDRQDIQIFFAAFDASINYTTANR